MFAIRDSDKLRSCLLFDIGYVYLKPNYYSKFKILLICLSLYVRDTEIHCKFTKNNYI